jgi:hypothetical protein
LSWLEKEKTKDKVELDSNKKKFINEIRKLKKEELIKTPQKISLWKRILIMIWGR